jgi:OOP family OmpA-OmpF porin
MCALRSVGLVPLLWLWVGAEALAQTGGDLPAAPRLDRSFDVQTFHPAVGSQSFITLDSAEVLEHRMWHFGLVANYQRQPLSYTLSSLGESGGSSKLSPVRDLAMAELVTAMGFLGRYELGLALPLAVSWGGDGFDSYGRGTGQSAARVWGVGDLRVEGKGELVGFGRDRAFLLSVSAGGTLPTGDDSAFLGDQSVTGRARALLEYQRGERLRAVAMVGGLFRGRSEFLGTPASHAALYGGAVELRPNQQIGVLAEIVGRFASRYADTNPVELDAAMRFYVPPMLSLLMGGGLGLNQGIGSPVVRGFVGLGWAPDYRDRDHDGIPDVYDLCPDEAEDRDGFKDSDGCPELDNDGDDIPDTADKCPNEAEDKDRFQDEDGCPDADNDGDGMPDLNDACPNEKEDGKGKRPGDGCPSTAEDSDGDGVSDPVDKCPEEPEDKDGFQDDDGCPDYDNDGDGIPDGYDACPNEAEDFDGFDDNDGCPELDNDHDGVPDKKDKCPNQPETLNEFKDDDGCPDGPALVSLGEEDERLTLVEHINFYPGPGGKPALTTNSHMLIGLVARVLKNHPEVAKVRIDVRGKDLTRESSEARAQVVLGALVKAGIAADRLKASGLGAGPNRVELVVEGRTRVLRAAPIPVVPSTDEADAPEAPAEAPAQDEQAGEPAPATPADPTTPGSEETGREVQ